MFVIERVALVHGSHMFSHCSSCSRNADTVYIEARALYPYRYISHVSLLQDLLAFSVLFFSTDFDRLFSPTSRELRDY
jgi:hypothetical protein